MRLVQGFPFQPSSPSANLSQSMKTASATTTTTTTTVHLPNSQADKLNLFKCAAAETSPLSASDILSPLFPCSLSLSASAALSSLCFPLREESPFLHLFVVLCATYPVTTFPLVVFFFFLPFNVIFFIFTTAG